VGLEPERLLIGGDGLSQELALLRSIFGRANIRISQIVVAGLAEAGHCSSLAKASGGLLVAPHPVEGIADRVVQRRVSGPLQRLVKGLVGLAVPACVVGALSPPDFPQNRTAAREQDHAEDPEG